MSSENKSLLTKGIGGIGAALLVLNGLIGAGIFALPAKMAAELGAFSPYIFLIFDDIFNAQGVPLATLRGAFSRQMAHENFDGR